MVGEGRCVSRGGGLPPLVCKTGPTHMSEAPKEREGPRGGSLHN